MRVGNPTRAVVGLLIAALCTGALLLIALTVFGPETSTTNSRIALTVLALGFTGVTGVAGSNLARERSGFAGFGYLTMAVALAAFVIATLSIWAVFDLDDGTRMSAYALVLAFATGHASYLIRPAQADSRSIRWVRTATLLPLVALVAIAFVDLAAHRSEVGADATSVVVVLYALGIALLPLTRRLAAN